MHSTLWNARQPPCANLTATYTPLLTRVRLRFWRDLVPPRLQQYFDMSRANVKRDTGDPPESGESSKLRQASRSVSLLSPEQLQRKRAQDRESQRQTRYVEGVAPRRTKSWLSEEHAWNKQSRSWRSRSRSWLRNFILPGWKMPLSRRKISWLLQAQFPRWHRHQLSRARRPSPKAQLRSWAW